ncbi:gas vesicle protein GvpG [Nocardioides mesophilus]|uniref:Gas vesicle protein GvpG n=1 Tax=Nocardioides mesophilus TaxID=433659 RepID=A0A7G9R7G7_9ACTN|nr:gas vesicle protein GvpG [Nocardioides mesophilus]QNN51542.1 gas vesicle protein GvpG [Nocardioides mesophilus]
MGLISGLLTWPVAPVRGVVWVAEQVQAEAERQWYDPQRIQEELDALEARRQAGLITQAEAEEAEEALVQRLLEGPRHG